MEILLIAACAWLAYTAGAQSEQSKLGMPPGQRDAMREKTRHEKAVRKIAEKHGDAAAVPADSASPWGGTSSGRDVAHEAPDTFRSGYRSRRPARPPLSHRAGTWAGSGITWAQDTGRDAWQKHRKRRRDAGHDDPGPVETLPRDPASTAPPAPTSPPPVDVDDSKKTADATSKPDSTPASTTGKPDELAKPAETEAKEPAADLKKEPEPAPAPPEEPKEPEKPKKPTLGNAGEEPKTEPGSPDKPAEDAAPDVAQPDTTPTAPPQPASIPQGVGRMAAEVTYGSVIDESDELSLMCDDDVLVYDRIRTRGEREASRADELIASMTLAGVGDRVIGWVARCKEQYQLINQGLNDLEQNTIAQGEGVVKAKALLQQGQGVFAGIAQDMESVADRHYYTGDAVDAEDTSAHTEIYETKGA